MPFSHVSNSYQPEQLKKLTEAFDLAWPQIMLSHSQQPTSNWNTRQRLANFIAGSTEKLTSSLLVGEVGFCGDRQVVQSHRRRPDRP